MKNTNMQKQKYLRPEVEIVKLQPSEILTDNGLSAFNIESKTLDWLLS